VKNTKTNSGTFAKFCKKNKIAKDSIRWLTMGDKTVKISIGKDDFKDGGWSLLSVGLVFALRQLGLGMDITIREVKDDIEVIVEK